MLEYILLASIVVSLVSFSGAILFVTNKKKLTPFLILFVAFAAGTLLATSFFHLLPESVELYNEHIEHLEHLEELEEAADHAHEEEEKHNHMLLPSYFVLFGILLFYFIEKFVSWHHHHDLDCKHHFLTSMSLIGDAFHNLLDGFLIAAAFLTNTAVGIATTLAIIFHEIPQEIGDLSILLHGGFSRVKALLWNFGSALFSVIGALAGFFFFSSLESAIPLFIALTAGGFTYIALADIIPELHHGKHKMNRFALTGAFLIGIILIYLLTLGIAH